MTSYIPASIQTKTNDSDFNIAFMNSLKDISPDSPLHIDWLYGIRTLADLDTYAWLYTFPNTKGKYDLKDVVASLPEVELEGGTKRVYQSNGLYRAYHVKDNVPVITIIITVTRSECTLSLIGENEHVEHIKTKMESIYTIPQNIRISKLTGFTQQGPSIRSEEFSTDDPSLFFSKEAFYPYLDNLNIDQLAKDYKESKASVMLLIGPPGTGKSTFIRTLIFKMNMAHNFVVLGDNTLMDPAFTDFLHGSEPETLFSIEDADKLCMPREAGDGNYQMSSLLNFADGIIAVGSKVIIATNLSTLNKVDPALIRDGRAFKVMEFKELSQEEANNARKAIGLEPVDFKDRNSITLASALNWSDDNINPLATKVGFGS